jgi:hypothetical protein
MPHCWGICLPYGLHIRRTGHNPPSEPSVNVTGANGLTCLPKCGRACDSKFLVTHPMTDQRCLIPRSYDEHTDRWAIEILFFAWEFRLHIPCKLRKLFYVCNLPADITLNIRIYIPLTLYPRRGSRGISNIPPRHPHFTKIS